MSWIGTRLFLFERRCGMLKVFASCLGTTDIDEIQVNQLIQNDWWSQKRLTLIIAIIIVVLNE